MNFIKEYQSYKHLTADGILGRNTLSTLAKDLGINNLISFAHFLGQSHHESGGFTRGQENLNYSSEALHKYFSKYFKEGEYSEYARNPIKIANRIYANRMGNGNEESGDGYKYRGVGPIQLTGKNNILSYFKSVGLDLNSFPSIILSPEHYFRSAKFFFDTNDLWKYTKTMDKQSILKVSRGINLGNPESEKIPIGLEDRQIWTFKYYKILANSSR